LIGRLALEPVPRDGTKKMQLPGLAQRRTATACLALFLLLLALAFLGPGGGPLALFDAFYRAGSLVFGGGHVVLPTLRDALIVPGWVSPELFLAGYGAAQAMPGPLFTVAAFLGTVSSVGPGGIYGGIIALLAIFLPGLLLAGGALPYWQVLQAREDAASIMMGVNAAVVGLLGAAFIGLLSLTSAQDILGGPVILAALALLTWGGVRPVLVVLFCALAGAVF
jgi:chromate transporter